MRIFTACLQTETNTFAPWPTGEEDFFQHVFFRTDASRSGAAMENLIARRWRARAEADGRELVESLTAVAEPSGPTVQHVYERLRDVILDDLAARGPFDVILLVLHGAMVASACDDCEGDLLTRVRAIAGPSAIIGAELDPHCHLTEEMTANADAIILMKEYPHTDFIARCDELYDICTGAAQGALKPVQALFDPRMVGFYPTTAEPMRSLVEALCEAERKPGVLSASFAHGFPWGDTPETGSKILVIADGDAELATREAERLARKFYAARMAMLPQMPGIDEALNEAARLPRLVVLADTADNAGGGAPGDNVALLRAMLARGSKDAAFGAVWDPIAVDVCQKAGLGAEIALRLGGKCGPASGDPIDVFATVRGLKAEHDQAAFGTARLPLGDCAWVTVGGVDVLLSSARSQIFAPDAFEGLGMALAGKRLIAVKSSHHFHAGFAPIADTIIAVATPGALEMDFAKIAYRKKTDMAFFPRVADPLGWD